MEDLIQRLIQRLNEAFARVKNLQAATDKFQEALKKPDFPPNKLMELARNYSSQVEEGLNNLEASLKDALAAANELAKFPPSPEPQAIKPDDLAKNLRSVIENLQLEARQPRAGEIAATLKSLDIEMKGLIVVQDNEARIVSPTLTRPVDPGQLSTIRMSFGTVPVLRPQEAQPPPTPPPTPEPQ